MQGSPFKQKAAFILRQLRDVTQGQSLLDVLSGTVLTLPQIPAQIRVIGDHSLTLHRVSRGVERRGAGWLIRHGHRSEMKNFGGTDHL